MTKNHIFQRSTCLPCISFELASSRSPGAGAARYVLGSSSSGVCERCRCRRVSSERRVRAVSLLVALSLCASDEEQQVHLFSPMDGAVVLV